MGSRRGGLSPLWPLEGLSAVTEERAEFGLSWILGLELAISPAGLGSAASEQLGWGVSEFQNVTEARSELCFGRPFPTVDTSVDNLGTSPWPRAEGIRALLVGVEAT